MNFYISASAADLKRSFRDFSKADFQAESFSAVLQTPICSPNSLISLIQRVKKIPFYSNQVERPTPSGTTPNDRQRQ